MIHRLSETLGLPTLDSLSFTQALKRLKPWALWMRAGSILRLLTTVHDWCPNVRHLPKRESLWRLGITGRSAPTRPMASACRSGLAVSSGPNSPRVTAPVSSTALGEAGGGHGPSRVVPSVKGVTCVLRKCPHGACILYSSVSVTLVCISTIMCSIYSNFFTQQYKVLLV